MQAWNNRKEWVFNCSVFWATSRLLFSIHCWERWIRTNEDYTKQSPCLRQSPFDRSGSSQFLHVCCEGWIRTNDFSLWDWCDRPLSLPRNFVGTPRFELGLREPKSLVLPLHHVPITWFDRINDCRMKKEPIPIEVTAIFANQITFVNQTCSLFIKCQISLFCFTFTMQNYKTFLI